MRLRLRSDSASKRRLKSRYALEVINWAQRNGLFFGVIILVIVFQALNSHFLNFNNIAVILLQVSVVGIVAVPGAMLIMAGYVDLSVGSVAMLTAICFGAFVQDGMSVWVAFTCALLVAAGCGLFNGVLIAFLGLSPIVVTLGVLAGASGVAEVISGGNTQNAFGNSFAQLGNGIAWGLNTPVWIAAGAFLFGGYLWYLTPLGRHLSAIGADPKAARSLGLSVRRVPCLTYVASGLAAGLGGLILASELDSASLTIGVNLELSVLTAILLGGVSFNGGRGSLFGVLMGVIFIGALDNGLVVVNINPFYQGVAIGLALIAAAALDVIYQRLERIEIEAEHVGDSEGERAVKAAVV
jgi:ribose transport system permease protein